MSIRLLYKNGICKFNNFYKKTNIHKNKRINEMKLKIKNIKLKKRLDKVLKEISGRPDGFLISLVSYDSDNYYQNCYECWISNIFIKNGSIFISETFKNDYEDRNYITTYELKSNPNFLNNYPIENELGL
jgi:hypothetical protein